MHKKDFQLLDNLQIQLIFLCYENETKAEMGINGDHKRSERSYLRNVHHSVTAEGPGRGQVIEAQQDRDDTILVNPANHGPIHKEDYAILINCNACR